MSRWTWIIASSSAILWCLHSADGAEQIVALQITERAPPGAHLQKIEWRLGLIDGKLGFKATLPGAVDRPDMPRLPYARRQICESYRWVTNGDTLQIDVDQAQADVWKVQAEKSGWYLTADYSGGEPKVILSKDATKYSHWQFLDKEILVPKEVEQFHVKDLDDLSKPKWLGMEAKGNRYQGRIEIRKPALVEEKQSIEFHWRSGY
jgi:hypothetical protein